MSAKVVNLNQFRKARAKSERVTKASINRKKHGRTKAEKHADKTARDKAIQHLDNHQIDGDDQGTTA